MKRQCVRGLFLGLIFTLGTGNAWAEFLTAVDLDPGTPGFQSSLTVAPGDVFTVEVGIFTDLFPVADPDLIFDKVILDILFNNAGSVLAFVPGSVKAGALPGFSGSPLFVADALTAVFPITPGDPLTVGAAGVPLIFAGAFADTIGGAGLIAPGIAPFTVPATGFSGIVSVYSAEFVALAPGESRLEAAGLDPFVDELMLGGVAIGADGLFISTVTVVPEPSTFTLLGIGSVALVGYGWRRKRKRAA